MKPLNEVIFLKVKKQHIGSQINFFNFLFDVGN